LVWDCSAVDCSFVFFILDEVGPLLVFLVAK
jgi:hypothetical protein